MEQKESSSGDASLDILYEIALKVLDKQIETADSLDGRFRSIFTFISLIFGVPFFFLYSGFQKFSTIQIMTFFTILILFIAIIFISLLPVRITRQKYLIRGKQSIVGIVELNPESFLLKSKLIELIAEQHEYNEQILLQKLSHIRILYLLILIDLLGVIAFLIYLKVLPALL